MSNSSPYMQNEVSSRSHNNAHFKIFTHYPKKYPTPDFAAPISATKEDPLKEQITKTLGQYDEVIHGILPHIFHSVPGSDHLCGLEDYPNTPLSPPSKNAMFVYNNDNMRPNSSAKYQHNRQSMHNKGRIYQPSNSRNTPKQDTIRSSQSHLSERCGYNTSKPSKFRGYNEDSSKSQPYTSKQNKFRPYNPVIAKQSPKSQSNKNSPAIKMEPIECQIDNLNNRQQGGEKQSRTSKSYSSTANDLNSDYIRNQKNDSNAEEVKSILTNISINVKKEIDETEDPLQAPQSEESFRQVQLRKTNLDLSLPFGQDIEFNDAFDRAMEPLPTLVTRIETPLTGKKKTLLVPNDLNHARFNKDINNINSNNSISNIINNNNNITNSIYNNDNINSVQNEFVKPLQISHQNPKSRSEQESRLDTYIYDSDDAMHVPTSPTEIWTDNSIDQTVPHQDVIVSPDSSDRSNNSPGISSPPRGYYSLDNISSIDNAQNAYQSNQTANLNETDNTVMQTLSDTSDDENDHNWKKELIDSKMTADINIYEYEPKECYVSDQTIKVECGSYSVTSFEPSSYTQPSRTSYSEAENLLTRNFEPQSHAQTHIVSRGKSIHNSEPPTSECSLKSSIRKDSCGSDLVVHGTDSESKQLIVSIPMPFNAKLELMVKLSTEGLKLSFNQHQIVNNKQTAFVQPIQRLTTNNQNQHSSNRNQNHLSPAKKISESLGKPRKLFNASQTLESNSIEEATSLINPTSSSHFTEPKTNDTIAVDVANVSIGVQSRNNSTTNLSNKLPAINKNSKQTSKSDYCKEATALKHEGDRTRNKYEKALYYCDSAVSFMLYGYQLESDKTPMPSIMSTYSSTFEMLKFVLQPSDSESGGGLGFIKQQHNELVLMCLRCQSVICNRIFILKHEDLCDVHKELYDYFNDFNSETKAKTPVSNVSPYGNPRDSPGVNTVAVPQHILNKNSDYLQVVNESFRSLDLWQKSRSYEEICKDFIMEVNETVGKSLSRFSTIEDTTEWCKSGIQRLKQSRT